MSASSAVTNSAFLKLLCAKDWDVCPAGPYDPGVLKNKRGRNVVILHSTASVHHADHANRLYLSNSRKWYGDTRGILRDLWLQEDVHKPYLKRSKS